MQGMGVLARSGAPFSAQGAPSRERGAAEAEAVGVRGSTMESTGGTSMAQVLAASRTGECEAALVLMPWVGAALMVRGCTPVAR